MEIDKHMIHEALSNLKYQFDQYKEYHYNSRAHFRKPDRERACRNMITSSTCIKNLLTRPPLSKIVLDGNPFQFEDFWKFYYTMLIP